MGTDAPNCDGILAGGPAEDPDWPDAGTIACGGEEELFLTLYDRYRPLVSMTYILETWQYACLEDHYLNVLYLFAKKEFWEGKELCFDNREYLDDDDPPFTVHNNCFATGSSAAGFLECHTQGYKLELRVVDDGPEAAEAEGRPWPIRLPKMYVKVSFHTVQDYF